MTCPAEEKTCLGLMEYGQHKCTCTTVFTQNTDRDSSVYRNVVQQIYSNTQTVTLPDAHFTHLQEADRLTMQQLLQPAQAALEPLLAGNWQLGASYPPAGPTERLET